MGAAAADAGNERAAGAESPAAATLAGRQQQQRLAEARAGLRCHRPRGGRRPRRRRFWAGWKASLEI